MIKSRLTIKGFWSYYRQLGSKGDLNHVREELPTIPETILADTVPSREPATIQLVAIAFLMWHYGSLSADVSDRRLRLECFMLAGCCTRAIFK
jgi:hypothetical protein